ncbi:MAG: 5-formyltetrahydrofolate cyclo-ligase [Burkholderiales bacterium]|nr:5-formyltetrahydrofolate cyclo-ligase [Burkholderiales bacterium]
MNPTDVKRALRKSIIAERDALSDVERIGKSAIITEKITSLDAFESAGLVLAYMNFGSEYDTRELVSRVLESGKALALPKLKKDRSGLDLHIVTDLAGGLEEGIWGILEPKGGDLVEDSSLVDFFLVPGVAFTRQGDRLGYGGGYYDRLLCKKRADAATIAAAFSFQVVEQLPLEDNDLPVDRVVTELDMHVRNF